MTDISTGQQWRHKKRGTTYVIIDDDCRIQCPVAFLEPERWVAYRDIRGAPHPMVFRMYREFGDGRFEQVWFDGGR